MATFALVNATTWVGGHDFTTDTNSLSLNVESEELDVTTFGGNGYRQRIGGLKTTSGQLGGFWDSTPDAEAFSNLGVRDRVVTMTPDGQESSVAYLHRAGQFGYQPFGAVGEAAPFTLSMMGTDPHGVIRGQLALASGDVSATGAVGVGVDLGALGSGQFIWASFHVFAAGTTITVDIERDDNGSFSAPTTVHTIGPLTATGGTWVRQSSIVSGDNFYRFNVTAVTGTFTVGGAIAVQ